MVALLSSDAIAQNTDSHLNVGLGLSRWGIPLHFSYDFPVASDINLAPWTSIQSYNERVKYNSNELNWSHTIIGLGVSGQYYFDSLLELPEQFDVYGGLGLGFYIWNTKYKGNDFNNVDYTGSASGGLGGFLFVGGRYYMNDKVALNLELKGGNLLSVGQFGVSFRL